MISLIPVKPEERDLFWNINQKYLYEMTHYYPDEMDEQGNYHYGYFEKYFVDPKRKAYFILNDEKKVGFVMIHPYSVIGKHPDHTMAEFTIFPAFRKNGFAKDAVKQIFSLYRGKWEIKYNEKNTAAKAFWTKMTNDFSPTIFSLNEWETVLSFTVE